MINCHYCDFSCEEYQDLALHVVKNKTTHRHGMTWASSFLLKAQFLNQKKDFGSRIELTEQDKENKVNTQRELSGKVTSTLTICPQCERKRLEYLPTEYCENPFAWRKSSALIVTCPHCRK